MNPRKYLKCVSLLLLLSTSSANADLLFTNFDGDPVGGTLYTAGGSCDFSCFAIADNFSNDKLWSVTGFTYYLVSAQSAGTVASNVAFALFSAAGTQIVAPTDTAVTLTDTGLTYPDGYKIYKLEIAGLDIRLDAGEYSFRVTNRDTQGVYPGYGDTSVQTIDPGFTQLTGSASVDPLASTNVTQRSENLAFQVYGTIVEVFGDGFEAP